MFKGKSMPVLLNSQNSNFEKEFKNKKECEVWLIRKRFYGMPLNKKIVLDDCYKKK